MTAMYVFMVVIVGLWVHRKRRVFQHDQKVKDVSLCFRLLFQSSLFPDPFHVPCWTQVTTLSETARQLSE